MAARVDSVRGILGHARRLYDNNVGALSLEEALSSAGGFRSILGVLKHMGGWVHVYRSYAFDPEPRHWEQTAWPRGLRDTVVATDDYLREVVAWVDTGLQDWDDALAHVSDNALTQPHAVHWGDTMPLGAIVVMVAHEVMYHTGEINMLLSIARGEAWEYGEEVEENHISTLGHRVRPGWMTDDEAHAYETAMRNANTER
jgi:hypothetical protein